MLLLTAPPPGVEGDEGPFVKVDGRECLLRCAEMFATRDDIAQVLTVFRSADAEELKQRFGGHLSFSGVKLGEPADAWHGQIASLAARVGEGITHVLVHDAARPALAFSDVDALLEAAGHHSGRPIGLAAHVESGLVEVDGQGHAVGYRPAEAFRLLLWPRLYPKELLADLSQGREPPAERLHLVPGLSQNVRCSHPSDAKRVAAMIKLLPERKREGPLSPFEEAKW